MRTEFKGVVADRGDFLSYRRCRLTIDLPKRFAYTAGHVWLEPVAEPDLWRAGFTKYAARMLGDFVELSPQLRPGDPVRLGQEIGSYEGLKAVTALYCAVDGVLERVNPALAGGDGWTQTDPHSSGWLYEARGRPDPGRVDACGYIALLDAAIDKLGADL